MDRWCYEFIQDYQAIKELSLEDIKPKRISEGSDLTLVGSGYSTTLAIELKNRFSTKEISADTFDLRIINPLDISSIIKSVKNTGKLFVIDDGWQSCSIGSEIIASVAEKIKSKNIIYHRFNILNSPAPSSLKLEKIYYHNIENIFKNILAKLK